MTNVYPLYLWPQPTAMNEPGSIGGAVSDPAEEIHQLLGAVTGSKTLGTGKWMKMGG